MDFLKKPFQILVGADSTLVTSALVGGAMCVAGSSTTFAQQDEGYDKVDQPVELSTLVFGDTEEAPFNLGGWTQFGYHSQSTGLFNKHPDRVNLHQQYLYTERVADGTDGLDFGWRFDAIYGVDAQDTQAFSNPPDAFDEGWDNGIYGWALPQLYGEAAVGDFSVKAGHFYTIIGYESVMAPSNFFYSHAFTMYNNEPFTHTGVLASTLLGDDDQTTLWYGYTLGWDTGFARDDDAVRSQLTPNGNPALDLAGNPIEIDPSDGSKGSNFIGGISHALTENLKVIYSTVAGDFGQRGEGYMHSFIVDALLTDRLEYVFQNDFLRTNNVAGPGRADSYDFNQYLFYTINDHLRAGVRGEVWNYDGHTIHEITTGLNIRPFGPADNAHVNFVLRPELRWQWAANDTDERFFNNAFGIPASSDGDTIFGIDAILVY